MIEISEKDLPLHIGKIVIVKEGLKESIVVFSELKGWLVGFNKTDHSFIQILIGSNKGELKRSYFLE